MFKDTFYKALSYVLVFSMLCGISTPLAYAAGSRAEITGDQAVFMPFSDDTEGEKQQVNVTDDTIAFENTDRRDVSTKDYRLTDGSNAVFLYPIDVHEKDASGTWVEIDNLLKLSKNDNGENVYSASRMEAVTELYEEPGAYSIKILPYREWLLFYSEW